MDEAPKLIPVERKRESLAVVYSPAAAPAGWAPVKEINLLDYLMVLRKHQWMILSFLLTVVTIVTIATFKMKPVYIASARVEVDRETNNPLPFQGSDYDEYADIDNYIQTQAQILSSETLAMDTIRSLDLPRYPEFGGNPQALVNAGPNQPAPPILGDFLGRLTVTRVPDSRLIEVQFAAEDPQLAAKVVNAHLHNYVERNFKSRYDATMQASNFLSSELEELRIKMEKADAAQVAYERDNQIWMVDANQNTTTQKLAALSTALTRTQTELAEREALYDLAHSAGAENLPVVEDSPEVQDLMRKKANIDEQYSDALSQFGPNWPKVQMLKAQQDTVGMQLKEAKNRSIQKIDNQYHEVEANAQLLERDLNRQELLADNMAQKLVQYNMLKHDAETNKQLYDGLLEKLKEAGISAGLRSSNIRIVDPALVPSFPSRPQKGRNILLALLVGLVGGVGLAYLREYLDNTIKSPDDVQNLAGLPCLAVVPAFAARNGSRALARLARQSGAANGDSRVELISLHQPKSVVSEAFRALRTSLLLSQADRAPQVILVTSALPREGKTTSAANLAITLAQLGDRTILLDSDLRKPGVRRALNLSNGHLHEVGLSSYLAGVATLRDIIISHPNVPNLDAITTGPIPPNPADLLSSHRMAEAIEDLRQNYKFIVIDSPPIMAATDAVILSALTDGVLLIVWSNETPKQAFSRTRELLTAVKSHLLGVVLNAVDSGAPDYYYSYRYYPYSYGYGEEEAENNRSSAKIS